MTKKRLVVLNIILLIGLILISIKENYPSRILRKFKTEEVKDIPYSNNWRYKQEMSLYPYYKKKGTIVMLGNSITYRVDWNELLNRSDVINRGVGSDITKGMLERLPHVINTSPQLCFVMGGVNDLNAGGPIDTIVSNLEKIAAVLKQNEVKPVIFSILHVSDTYQDYAEFNKKVKQTNEAIKKMCADHNIEFVDLNRSLSENEMLKTEYSFDGIHLTGLGYSKWRDAILPIIEREIE
ncbi:D-alanyl-lipoteichoic acid biosynthesis protein DltD [Flagellimonas iocasae]|uniref:D-alanyl-lipoteichoic acid biosynthesis protein DltD n=1 Tax=Flagellimonas iocasae TaxID=2055905 RepID=A0ABW4XZX4_9FLAO